MAWQLPVDKTPQYRHARPLQGGQRPDRLTISGYNRLNSKTKQHAHQLRQAMAGAVELHVQGKWGRPEIESAGLRDYASAFGRPISARHFWRLFDQVIERDGGKGDFNNLAIYLPGRLVRKAAPEAFAKYAQQLTSPVGAVFCTGRNKMFIHGCLLTDSVFPSRR